MVECDGSVHGLGAVLYQPDAQGKLWPVQYASKSVSRTKKDRTQPQLEIMALLFALRKWRPHLLGKRFTVLTDHANTKYYLRNYDSLNWHMARWCTEVMSYDFELKIVPAKDVVASDALGRLERFQENPELRDDRPMEGEDLRAWFTDVWKLPADFSDELQSKEISVGSHERIERAFHKHNPERNGEPIERDELRVWFARMWGASEISKDLKSNEVSQFQGLISQICHPAEYENRVGRESLVSDDDEISMGVLAALKKKESQTGITNYPGTRKLPKKALAQPRDPHKSMKI